MMTADVPAKLKHLSAQVAMAAQWSMAFSHGLALCGQQSAISSVMEVPAASGDFALAPASAAGSIATDRAIRSVTMARPTLMREKDSRLLAPAVKDEFASRLEVPLTAPQIGIS
jgi:hypothetical protein